MELTVAMVVIAVVLSSLVGLQLKALKGVGLAKQRQTATALANKKVEHVRALPYDTVRLGLSTAKAAAETGYIVGGRLRAPWDEAVVVNASQVHPELSTVTETTTVDHVTYTTRTFLTHPKNADGTDSDSSVDFWLTVAVEWVSGLTGGETKSVVVRTRTVYPAGCSGTVDHPYAGPCQAFHYANAGLTNVSINLASANPSTEPLQGSTFQALDLVLGGMSANAQTEQTPSAQGSLMTAGLLQDSVATLPQDVVTAVSDVDPATDATGEPSVSGLGPWTAPTQTLPTAIGSLHASFASSDGTAVAATSQTTSPECADLQGATVATEQPCSSSMQTQGGTSSLTLDLDELSGRDLGEFSLSAVTPGAAPMRAYGARFVNGTPAHCTGTSKEGCVTAASARSLSEVTTGHLPAGVSSDQLPAGFTGPLASVTAYRDSASAESGIASAAVTPGIDPAHPTARRFGLGRGGTLTYWNGASYSEVDLQTVTTDQTFALGTVTGVYRVGAVDAVTVTVTGEIVVGRPKTHEATSAGCEPSACTAKATAGSVVAKLTYLISGAAEGTVAHFTVTTNLGSATASTSYRGLPSV